MNKEKTIATYKIVADAGGNIYKFYCDLSDALVCTTKPYKADTPEQELQLACEKHRALRKAVVDIGVLKHTIF